MPETHAPAARDDATPPALGRRLFGAGLAGLAASVLPGLASRASASPDDTTDDSVPTQGSTPREGEDTGNTGNVTVVPTGPTPDETDAAPPPSDAGTTTTEFTRRPTQEDTGPLGFMQQIENAVVRLYDTALAGDALDETSRAVFATIRESHQGYGQAAGALLGQEAPTEAEIDIPELADLDFGASSVRELADAAYQAEAIALTTHLDTIGRITGTEGGRMLASIAVMEARHCVVLSELAGRTGLAAYELPDVGPLAMAEG